MSYQHKQLAESAWQELNLMEQLANVGSEVSRALNWRERGKKDYSLRAFFRALELIDLTIADPKNRTRLKEICRMREVLVDYFYGENEYHGTPESLRKYFLSFNYAARKER